MRLRRFLISGMFLVMISEENWEAAAKCVKGLPRDCRFIRSYEDSYFGIWIVVEHPSFDMVKDGDEIPDFGQILYEKL